MPIQHSPPARTTRSQAITQAVLSPTQIEPLDCTPAVPQLRSQLDRGPIIEGEAPSIQEGRGPRRGPGEDDAEEEENSVEEEESDGTGAAPTGVGASQGTEGPTLAHSNQPVSHHSVPSLLAIMQRITQIMENLQASPTAEA
ncbi:hypothetical protein O181_005874 [Austropuccinia psidii MF-1]|uniref:Uncharacterized protein n=1 Tax=Austropuccinia psidii MF-1 TaxID=1389203 RepID=A0A9Q3BIZ0_9BASI|nr:hypothetical protein [Austropuccinia psidii MF-1]